MHFQEEFLHGLRVKNLVVSLLWLGSDPWPLAWELPNAVDVTGKKKKERKKNVLLGACAALS